ncbi:MAG: ABA4-like family protein, partial [Gammaproteobacteria bacterium]|nr:ABA4-like family protein [Gammaproteobacteria bacterium]
YLRLPFYAWLMISNSPPDGGGFGSLASVMILFSDPNLLLAGWIHYLAFDLFVGAWEVRDAQRTGIHHLLVVPCLFATLMAGPAGLAFYWLLRLFVVQTKKRQSKVDNRAP